MELVDISYTERLERAMYQSKKQKGCSAVIYGEEMPKNSERLRCRIT